MLERLLILIFLFLKLLHASSEALSLLLELFFPLFSQSVFFFELVFLPLDVVLELCNLLQKGRFFFFRSVLGLLEQSSEPLDLLSHILILGLAISILCEGLNHDFVCLNDLHSLFLYVHLFQPLDFIFKFLLFRLFFLESLLQLFDFLI